MHAVLASVGTDGDILPYVGLGAVLRASGHNVTLVASEQYEPLARRHDLAFQPLVSLQEHDELFGHPDFWNPLKTAPLAGRWGMRFLRRQYDLISRLVDRKTVMVASPALLAASLVHEKSGVPLANLVLQPWMIRSSIAPPLMPHLTYLSRAPRTVWKLFWRSLDFVVDRLIGQELNRLRADLGLRPVQRIFHKWFSNQRVIGMFPEWYGQPQADWPSQLQLTGFPLFDGALRDELPPDVAEFCRSGAPPVAFTFGSGMQHSAGLFRDALEACERLRARGLLLTRHRNQLPDSLRGTVLHCTYAPFQRLFPLCAAVVHHGGIGTVASAMAAGTPQVIRPICFDQVDNGMRVKRLGVGGCIRARRPGGEEIASALAAVMTDECRTRCRNLMTRFGHARSLASSAELIEALATNRLSSSS